MKIKMLFINPEHKKFFQDMIKIIPYLDICRMVFFYLVGLLCETREHITELYDFEGNCISLDVLEGGAAWETFGTRQVCDMACNLYNGYYDPDHAGNYTPDSLFCTPLAPFFVCAIYMRYTEYFSMEFDDVVVGEAVW